MTDEARGAAGMAEVIDDIGGRLAYGDRWPEVKAAYAALQARQARRETWMQRVTTVVALAAVVMVSLGLSTAVVLLLIWLARVAL